MPRNSGTRWKFKNRLIKKIKDNYKEVILALSKLETGSFSQEPISRALGFLKLLKTNKFTFWLSLFYHVLISVSVLFLKIQKLNSTVDETKSCIESFKSQMQEIRNSNYTFSQQDSLSQQAKEVIDNIMVRVSSRITGSLLIYQFLHRENISLYKNSFPKSLVGSVKAAYPFINSKKIVSELTSFYPRVDIPDFNNCKKLLSVLLAYDLDKIFEEITVFVKILNTISLTTCTGERCFSSLRRTKDSLRNTLNQNKLNSLAVLSCNKEITQEFPSFKDEVINHFINSKNRK